MFFQVGKILIIFGIFLIIFGVFLMGASKLYFFGKLPGDILIKRENFTFYFPLGTSLILSLILSLLFFLITKFLK